MQSIKEKYLLFKASSNKDAEAYAELYDRYVHRIYRFIYFKIGNRADAEDITSEVFLKTWQYIKEGKQVKNLNALLYRMSRNAVVDHFRQQAKKRKFEEDIIMDIKSDENIVRKIDIKSSEEKILKALKSLKDEYSEAIILRYLDGLSVGTVSKIIGKSQNNTRVIVHRALVALKKIIEVDQKDIL